MNTGLQIEALEPRRALASDFGDAPDVGAGVGLANYETLLANNGPRHVVDLTRTRLFLGDNVDSEADAAPSALANNDDKFTSTADDEDGVVEPAQDLVFTLGAPAQVRVRATNTTTAVATLYGWIDYNRDGQFDNLSERASATVPIGTRDDTFVLTLPTPSLAGPAGTTYARFRLSSDAAASNAVGSANGGEVEDYVATLVRQSDGRVDRSRNTKIPPGPLLANGDAFGGGAASLGDLDRDGVGDIAVGANHGVHILFLNANGSVKNSLKIASNLNGGPNLDPREFFGSATASLGDLDGDGVVDLAVGAFRNPVGGPDRGAVHILFLNPNGTVKNARRIDGAAGVTLADYDFFGAALASPGDLDGDGVEDLVVGAPGDGPDYAGAVHVLFLNANGSVKSARKIASGVNGGPSLAPPSRRWET